MFRVYAVIRTYRNNVARIIQTLHLISQASKGRYPLELSRARIRIGHRVRLHLQMDLNARLLVILSNELRNVKH